MSTTTAPETMDAFLEKYGSKPISYKTATAALDAVQTATIEALKRHKATIAALEQRIVALEQRPPGVEYAGTFEAGTIYSKGALVTRQGSLWLSLQDSNAWPPGQSASHWKLIVKRGEAER